MPAPRTSHLRLHAAVLRLAAERPPAALTATEVAAAAGVHRSTFYEHADTIDGLLADALRAELDGIRAQHLGDATDDVEAAMAATTRAVLTHIERHEPIYRRALGDGAEGGLRTLLSSHFRDSLRMLEDDGRLHPPVSATGRSGRYGVEATAMFVAGGAVGLLEVWLAEPAPRDPALYLDAFGALTTGLIRRAAR